MDQQQEFLFLKSTYENLPTGVMQFQRDGDRLTLLHINDFGCKILGYETSSDYSFDFHSFIDKLPGNAYDEFIDALSRLKNIGDHFPFTRPIYVGEKKSWLSGTASLLSSSALTQTYICVFSDDTANVEKQLYSDYAKEKEIQILNEMCTLIVSQSYETLGLINTGNGKYQIYAVQDRDWFSQKKLEGDFDELTFHAAKELAYDEEAKELLMNATLSGITGYLNQRPDTSYSFTYRIRTHESYRWKRAEYSYLKDDKTNIIFCTQDIHSEKMEEEHLARLAEKERQIHQEKMAFFANMSHEIRTPMNAILNLSELLLRKNLPLDVEQDISTIYEIGNGLLGIINSLLSFSKLDTGNIQLTTGKYSPATMCSDICSIISARLSKKSLHFFTDLDPSIPRQLIGDEMRIREILTNLLANAVKFTVSGNIELKLRAKNLSKTKTELSFFISDTGSGIKEEDQKHLFRQFSRVDPKKNQTIMGTGLGLSISKKLTELMGGSISVESEYGKGSTFIVTIPQEICLAVPMIPPSDKMEQAEVYVYLPESDKELTKYVIRELRKLSIHPSLISSVSSISLDRSNKNSYLIMQQADFPSCQEMIDSLFLQDHVLLLMKNSDTTESKYYNYQQLYPYNLMMQTANILNGHPVKTASKKTNVYEDTTFPSAHILIVDDNDVNSSVAKRLMEPYEMDIDVASNGFDTLTMASAKDYDLIFLDHMMPGMDGIETVQKLRKMDGIRKDLPVVALTANVFSDAKTYFTEQGFSDFLAKPINVKELHNTLLQYLQDKAVLKIVEKKLDEAFILEEVKACFTSLKHFDVDASLEYFDHSADFYLEMLKTFRQGLFERRNELDKIYENQDIKLFTIHVHAIKSASKSVGALEFSDLAKTMEDFGHQNNWKSITQKYQELLDYTDLILEELDCCIKAVPAADETKESLSGYPEDIIKSLCIAVNEMDYQEVSDAIAKLDRYTYPGELQNLLDRLKTAYDNFEYGDLNRCSILMYNCL
ncbi:hypothetical protein K290105B7_27450 [Anaerostipes caccae]|uniref:ATP-binding protein n=1 Tax=Anaerostipes caccae TaxID=105841 RepID=UPI00101C3524|nr:ATP-binding protein [Anaerostipes caccae]